MATQTLPLFPLGTVLFPGGTLALRLFEPRYLDLVKRCGRSGEGFGICLIRSGAEVGEAAVPAPVGTEAVIVDFAMTEDGLLGITVEGRRRFEVQSTEQAPDRLLLGQVRWLPDEAPVPVPPEHALLATLLARILDKAGIDHDGEGKGRLADAAWVGYRLAEWLPLEPVERQAMLEEPDPLQRLQWLLGRVPDFQGD